MLYPVPSFVLRCDGRACSASIPGSYPGAMEALAQADGWLLRRHPLASLAYAHYCPKCRATLDADRFLFGEGT